VSPVSIIAIFLLTIVHDQKCDGAQPICGQCLRAKKPEDCEYTVGNEPTQNQLLEERIRVLETRIQELTSPARANANVTLHQPYQLLDSAQDHTMSVTTSTSGSKFPTFQVQDGIKYHELGSLEPPKEEATLLYANSAFLIFNKSLTNL
jgi:hypothetical protein